MKPPAWTIVQRERTMYRLLLIFQEKSPKKFRRTETAYRTLSASSVTLSSWCVPVLFVLCTHVVRAAYTCRTRCVLMLYTPCT